MTEKNENPTMEVVSFVNGGQTLKRVVLGDQVSIIGCAFDAEVLYLGMGSYGFSSFYRYEEVHYSDSLMEFLRESEGDCVSKHLYIGGKLIEGDLEVTNEMLELMGETFAYNQDIRRVIITDDNAYVRGYYFNSCTNLTELVIKGKDAVIAGGAFPYVTSLIVEGSIAKMGYGGVDILKTLRVVDVATWAKIDFDELSIFFDYNTEFYIIGEDTPCYEIIVPFSKEEVDEWLFYGLSRDYKIIYQPSE